jgi:hypothetical protein
MLFTGMDMAHAAVVLASDVSSDKTGVSLCVDGGLTMRPA